MKCHGSVICCRALYNIEKYLKTGVNKNIRVKTLCYNKIIYNFADK